MNSKIIEKLEKLPEFLRGNILIELGLFKDQDALWLSRKTKQSPDFIRVNKKILYLRDSVIDFIKKRFYHGTDRE